MVQLDAFVVEFQTTTLFPLCNVEPFLFIYSKLKFEARQHTKQ